MRTASITAWAVLLLAGCRLEHADSGRPPGTETAADSLARVEADSTLNANVIATLRDYYARVSERNWNGVRSAFLPGAVVTSRFLPAGERSERVVTQTVDEFVRRAPEGPGRPPVFHERLLHAHVTGYGDLADAWVVYERRSGTRRDSLRTERGIDAFHLYRQRGVWRIASLAATREDAQRPLVPPRPRRTTPARAAPRSSP